MSRYRVNRQDRSTLFWFIEVVVEDAEEDGEDATSFSDAKRQLIEELVYEIKIRKDMLREVRKLVKADIK